MEGKSSSFQVWSSKDSRTFWHILFHRTSKGVEWSLKMRLFLSFQMVHMWNPGISSRKAFNSFLLYGFVAQVDIMLVISSLIHPSFLHLKLTFSQSWFASGQYFMRCSVVSFAYLQFGHIEGPWKLLFRRLSKVKILFWQINQRKVDIFG